MTRRPSIALAVTGLLTLALSGPVAAQTDTSLADVFPDELGGSELEVTIQSGPEWVASFDSTVDIEQAVISRTESLVEGVGATLDDLTIATSIHTPSPGNVATISAVQVSDIPAHELIGGSIELLLGDVISPSLDVVFADRRDTLKVRDAEMPGAYPRTLVPAGDTLWIIEAEPPLLSEIVAQLPAPAGRADTAFDLAANVPLEVEGNRRVYLLVSSGWDLVFWLSEAYPQQLESVAVDAFLATGIPIEDINTTSSVWLDDGGEIGAVMAGYQFAGADEETMQTLLTDIILPRFQGFESRSEAGTLGGRDVVVVTDSSLLGESGEPRPFYLYASGDTVFAIDAPDETTAAAAIAALP